MSTENAKPTDPNARFWLWRHGWVKITIRPGDTITLRECGGTDEGFSQSIETYAHEGDLVRSEFHNYSSDCDGRHEWHAEHTCPMDRLADESAGDRDDVPENAGIWVPSWMKVGSGQRDHYAEAMGY